MAKVRKAVITAAGRGTRQYPASSVVPKEMFPLVDRDGVTRPVMQIIIEEALASGIEEICIITQPGNESIFRRYFAACDPPPGKDWMARESEKLAAIGERLHFAEQRSPEGFGHAVYQAKAFAGDEPFLLMLGDHVYVSGERRRCARQLIDVYEQHELEAATSVQLSPEEELPLFGTFRGRPVDGVAGSFATELIVEKPTVERARAELTTPGLPAGRYLCHFGLHIFNPPIFDALEHLITHSVREKGEIQLTAAQERLRAQGAKYWAVCIDGKRYDMGIPSGLIETQIGLSGKFD